MHDGAERSGRVSSVIDLEQPFQSRGRGGSSPSLTAKIFVKTANRIDW